MARPVSQRPFNGTSGAETAAEMRVVAQVGLRRTRSFSRRHWAAAAAHYTAHITSHSPVSRSRRKRDGRPDQRSAEPERRSGRRRPRRRTAEVIAFHQSASTHETHTQHRLTDVNTCRQPVQLQSSLYTHTYTRLKKRKSTRAPPVQAA